MQFTMWVHRIIPGHPGPQVKIRDLAKCTLIIYTCIEEQLYYNHEVVTSVHFVKIKTIFTKSFEIIPDQEILLRSSFLCLNHSAINTSVLEFNYSSHE